jgi:hypothetical protein
LSGFKIKSRRRKGAISENRFFGLGSSGLKIATRYVPGDEHINWRFLGDKSKVEMFKDTLLKSTGRFTVRIPVDKDSEKEKVLQAALTNKIVLGTGCWLWGDSFIKSSYADNLREGLFDTKLDEIVEVDEDFYHASWEGSKEELESLKGKEDVFNNFPNTTICIYKMEHLVRGLVNLFGILELTTTLGTYSPNCKLEPLDQDCIVVIASSTKNEIVRMTGEEYQKYKSQIR